MSKGAIIGLSILGVAGLATASFFAIRSINSKKEDDLTVDIGTVDWNKRLVPDKIKVNGKPWSTGTEIWRSDLVGKGTQDIMGDIKNKIYLTHLTNGLIITGDSLGTQKFAKIIDFNSKTVKDFKGNVGNAIAGTLQTLENLFA